MGSTRLVRLKGTSLEDLKEDSPQLMSTVTLSKLETLNEKDKHFRRQIIRKVVQGWMSSKYGGKPSTQPRRRQAIVRCQNCDKNRPVVANTPAR